MQPQQLIRQTCKYDHYIKFNHLLFFDVTDCPPSQATKIFVISAAFPCKRITETGLLIKEWNGKGHKTFIWVPLQFPTTGWMNSPLTAHGLGEELRYLGLGEKFQLYGYGETFIPVAC